MKRNRYLSDRYMNGQLARYYYREGMILNCIKMLLISEFTYKNFGMLFTVVIPPLRRWVLKHFRVSGVTY